MDALSRPTRSVVKIHLVGPIQAASPSGHALLPRSKRARAVLGIVGMARDHQCSRSQLAALLWDDASEDAARGSLRQALHELTKSFEAAAPGFLRADRETVSFDRQCCWIDIHAFGSGTCNPKLAVAEIAEFNPQRLLEDLNGISPSFDDWLLAERNAFGALLATEMDRQLTSALRPEVSVQQRHIIFGQILKFDPTHEQASRATMRAHVEMGETGLALKEFERCQTALRTALDIEPSAETRALYQTIRTASKISAESVDSYKYPPLPDRPSIAVLPFHNMSGDPEQDYFAGGMVDDIITALSRFKALFVIARNSSITYKGKAIDIKQVGRELGVRYALEGSVRRAAGKLRITAQLIETATGAQLWADRFDGAPADAFELQDMITEKVVGIISPTITQTELNRLKLRSTENLGAHECYHRALENIYRQSEEGNDAALRFCARAIELDPSFAAAYGLAANCFAYRLVYGWTKDRDRDVLEGSRLLKFAVAFGQDDARALAAAARFNAYALRETEIAINLSERAIALNPNLVDAWRVRGIIGVWLGQHEAAIGYLERALRLSPVDLSLYDTYQGIGSAYYFLHRYDQALSWITKALSHLPGAKVSMRFSIAARVGLGQIDEARRDMKKLLECEPGLTISYLRTVLPHRPPEDTELYLGNLRKAGLPE